MIRRKATEKSQASISCLPLLNVAVQSSQSALEHR
jgi:hypothetical protein